MRHPVTVTDVAEEYMADLRALKRELGEEHVREFCEAVLERMLVELGWEKRWVYWQGGWSNALYPCQADEEGAFPVYVKVEDDAE